MNISGHLQNCSDVRRSFHNSFPVHCVSHRATALPDLLQECPTGPPVNSVSSGPVQPCGPVPFAVTDQWCANATAITVSQQTERAMFYLGWVQLPYQLMGVSLQRNRPPSVGLIINLERISRARQLGLHVVGLATCTALGEQARGVIDVWLRYWHETYIYKLESAHSLLPLWFFVKILMQNVQVHRLLEGAKILPIC